MFNETSFNGLGDRSADCQALKDNCDTRFPPGEAGSPQEELWWNCMKATGYPAKCMDNKSYENPGSSTYLWDTVTNTQNPNTVWQWPDFIKTAANAWGIDPVVLVGGAAALLFGLFAMRR